MEEYSNAKHIYMYVYIYVYTVRLCFGTLLHTFDFRIKLQQQATENPFNILF